MKIIFIAPGSLSLPIKKYGGIERVVWNLANGFANKGFEVKILAKQDPTYTGNLIINPFQISNETFATDLKVADLPHHPEAYTRGILSYLDSNLASNDVVYLNHSEQFQIRKYLEQRNVKFFEVGHYRNFSGNTNIVFPSKALRRILFYKSGVVIPHPIDFDEFYFSSEKPIINEPYLLAVGRVTPKKQTKNSYILAKTLGLKCVLAGPIEDEEYARGFIDKCIYLGNCDSAKLRNLYSNSVVTSCLTSLHPPEAFGLFQVEAMACGSLVISSRTGGLKDTYRDNCCSEFSRFKSMKTIAKKFLSLQASAPSKEEISNQTWVRYSIENIVDEHIKRLKISNSKVCS